MTEQIHRTKINKSNDWPNKQSEDKQVKLQNKYTTCLSSFCVFVLSFDLFIFALCICSVIWLVYLRSVYLLCHLICLSSYRAKINKSNDKTNTQNEDKHVKLQNKYTELRKTSQMTEQIHRAMINNMPSIYSWFNFFDTRKNVFVIC
jgi:hypothetical protein